MKMFACFAIVAFIAGLNLKHAVNDYGVSTNAKLAHQIVAQAATTGGGDSSGGSSSGGDSSGGSSGESTSGNPKIKMCVDNIKCNGTKEFTVSGEGFITVNGKKIPVVTLKLTVSWPYYGTKQNCTGGDVYQDCNACQDDCVETIPSN